MAPEVMESFFEEAIKNIVSHLRHLLSKVETKGVDTIVMVGGFSESPLLSSAIRSHFPQMRVVVPRDAGLAVLKGAVIFGHLPSVIRERVSKYTYGTDIIPLFDANKHDFEKIVVDESGKCRCKDVFSKFIENGQTLVVGQAQIENKYSAFKSKQTSMGMNIYTTKEKDPKYVTDAGCRRIATFGVPLTGEGLARSIKVRAIFGGTEIQFECIEMNTGNVTVLDVDFLSC